MGRTADLMERAKAATGQEDFGEDSFREGLDILVASADRQARLTAQGAYMFDAMVIDFLSQRLQIEACYAAHPEIDEEEIVAPLIGLGAPRTGSTALSCLLAEDPDIRYLRTWESMAPCPPPESATQHSDPRIAMAAERGAMADQLFPRMKTLLPMSPTGPIECQSFMGYDFKSQVFFPSVQVPDYGQWLLHQADLTSTYRYLRRILKLLQWRCPPRRWRIKNPSHAPFIAALDSVFPDARYWTTHRTMTKVIPSVVDLFHVMGAAYSDDLDGAFLIEENLHWWETGLARMIAFRDGGQDHRFFDIAFADFMAGPIGQVERLYAFLGEPLTDVARARMEAWWRDNGRDGGQGGAGHDAAVLGIDLADVERRFAFYTERFGLASGAVQR